MAGMAEIHGDFVRGASEKEYSYRGAACLIVRGRWISIFPHWYDIL